ncbi:MAG: glycoside hydrolase family 97 N-terminal domain-containing protein, partial [Opitutales bacterium]|nr:glycoside hydrolase family 97 N-terminal domain-containing protein [Opitutales bacterium]
MQKLIPTLLLSSLLGLLPSANAADAAKLSVKSPDGQITVTFSITDAGAPQYAVNYNCKPLILDSQLGIKLQGDADLVDGFSIAQTSTVYNDESWKPVTGERSVIRDHYNELTINLSQGKQPNLQIKFRAYDEGMAFCYRFAKQSGRFTITEELSQFRFTADHFCWDTKDPQEVYRRVPISQAGNNIERPLVVEINDSPIVALGEARLVDYARLRFKTAAANTFGIELGSEVKVESPYDTPW